MRQEYQPSDLVSPSEAARIIGTSVNTVGRACQRAGIGLRLRSGRLAAIRCSDLRLVKENMRGEVGNPNWIAMRGKGRKVASR